MRHWISVTIILTSMPGSAWGSRLETANHIDAHYSLANGPREVASEGEAPEETVGHRGPNTKERERKKGQNKGSAPATAVQRHVLRNGEDQITFGIVRYVKQELAKSAGAPLQVKKSKAPLALTLHTRTKHKTRNPHGNCLHCHPEGASTDEKPLWTLEAPARRRFSSRYTSSTTDASTSGLSPMSALCLTCHDGVLASMSKPMSIGPDLSNDHPVSITYDSHLAAKDKKLAHPNDLPDTLPLFNGKIECSTCHNVHAPSGTKWLLRMSNSRSRMCLACHKM